MEYPALYQPGIQSLYFNGKRFWLWFINAVIQSVIVGEFSIRAMESNFVSHDGYEVDLWISGAMIFGLIVVMVNLKILTFSYSNTPLSLFILICSILLYIFSVAVVNFIISSDIYKEFADLWKIPNLYWGAIEIIIATNFMDLAVERYSHLIEVKSFRKMKKDTARRLYEEELKAQEERKAEAARLAAEKEKEFKMDRVDVKANPVAASSTLLRSNSKGYGHTGYAFSQEEQSNWFIKRQGLDHPQN